jgi:CRP-like cAMP-binding protein
MENIKLTERREYKLRIDAFSVETIPMARLAEYMTELARLFGEEERVHFTRLEAGSAVLVTTIEAPAAPKVEERLQKLRNGSASKDTLKAFKAIDTLLAKDNAIGLLIEGDGAKVIDFPGRTRVKPIRYGPFREHGSLDGIVIRIGGHGDSVPVLLSDAEGAEYSCVASRELSKRLARYYLEAILRVHGSGKWIREDDGSWRLLQFDIEDFEVLDDRSLVEVVSQLRSVEWHEWKDETISLDFEDIRGKSEERH